MQNGIRELLKEHPQIPVVTIHHLNEIDGIYEKLNAQGVSCIEITLRTDVALEAIHAFKQRYGATMSVGVGTIVSAKNVDDCKALGVDFMVSPGCSQALQQAMQESGIPYLPGAVTPSEIIRAQELGCDTLKFFPANLFGGLEALKAYAGLFPHIRFCPTGGVDAANKDAFLGLPNVLSVGGSWLLK